MKKFMIGTGFCYLLAGLVLVMFSGCNGTLPSIPPDWNWPGSTNLPPVVTNLPPVVTNLPPVVTNVPPVVTNVPPVVTNVPPTDIVVPPRMGANVYRGTGVNGTFQVVPNGKNPIKSVSMQTWVKFNGWPRPVEGCHIVNKGSVGRSWAFGMVIAPDRISYSATRGEVGSACRIDKGRWYHVRIDASSSDVSVWLDGKSLPITRRETAEIFSANNDPLRIGGHSMDWSPPSAWFNGSLDGEMSDWSVEVK